MISSRRTLVLIADLLTIFVAIYLALYLRLQDPFLKDQVWVYYRAVLIAVPVYLIAHYVLGLGRSLWQHISSKDVYRLIVVTTVLAMSLIAASYLLNAHFPLPRLSSITYWFIQLAFLVGARFAYRRFSLWRRLRLTSSKTKLPVLVLGQGVETEAFLRHCLEGSETQFSPIGILSRTQKFSGHSILDVPFLETIEKLETVLEDLSQNDIHPRRLIITDVKTFEALKASSTDFVDIARRYKIVISRVETTPENIDTKLSVNVLPVNVEDLLFRPVSAPIGLNERKLLEGSRVLITGGGGSIGTELCRQVMHAKPSELMVLDMSEFNLYTAEQELRKLTDNTELKFVYCNIRERERVLQIFQDFKPDFVFHAAAMKHVPIVEANRAEGVLTNIIGTKNIADACIEFETKGFVLISTDKAVNPTNFMGCTKRIAEMYCQSLNEKKPKNQPSTRFVAVRFGNVLGSSGSVIPLFKKQIEMGGPVTITHPEMTRFFMTIPEAISLVIKAFHHGYAESENTDNSLFVLDMGKPVKIIEMARQMIQLAGLQPDVDIMIEITGTRPGEKLEEELFYSEENLLRMGDSGIFVSQSTSKPHSLLVKQIEKAQKAAYSSDYDVIEQVIRDLVPGYHTLNIPN